MISRSILITALLGLLLCPLAALAGSVALLTASQGDSYLIAVVTRDDTREHILSSVRRRAASDGRQWDEVAVFRSELTSLAVTSGRVAALLDDGQWRLDRNVLGPPLPVGRMEQLVTAEDGLLAVGVTDGQPGALVRTLWRWSGGVWHRVADLPATGKAPPQVVEASGQVYVAEQHPDRFDITTLRGGQWSPVATRPMDGNAMLLAASGQHAVLERKNTGALLVLGGKELLLDTSGFDDFSEAAVVGSTLRLLRPAKNGAVDQLTFDLDTGQRHPGPDAIARVLGAPPAAPAWSQFGMMVLLATAVVLSMRQSPVPPPEFLEAAHVRLAPLGRRVAAGLIDAIPFIIGTILTGQIIASNDVPVDRPFLSFSSSLIGLAVYIAHTAITEAIVGRSIGKILLGLRVIGYDGARPGVAQLLMRNVMRLLDVFMLMMPLLLVVLSPTRQRIGDLASGTLVIQKQSQVPTSEEAQGDSG
jgi:uncharacterized RDD family membrane protein YckC